MTKTALALISLVTIALVLPLAIQRQACLKLRAENQSLQKRLDELALLAAENERLSNALAQARSSAPQEKKQTAELLRLRNEVAQLRQQTNAAAKVREENRRLQTSLSQARQNSSPSPQPQEPTPLADFPKDSWTFAGYATPDATYQTVLWAQLKADKDSFLQSLTPEKRQQVEFMLEKARQQGISEAQLKAQNDAFLNQTTGFQILERQVLTADEVRLTVSIAGRRIHPVLKKIGGEWKIQNMD
jgi:myosin heavy subunit